MKNKLIILSADAMVTEDLELFSTLPGYQKYLDGGCRINRVESVYPTVTYPCHTTMMTGNYPDRHGVTSNFVLAFNQKPTPWNRYADVICSRDIFTACREKGLTTAAVFWPVTGCHKDIDYKIPEYVPENGETIEQAFRKMGCEEDMIRIVEKNSSILKEWGHPYIDEFIIACACDILREKQPDVILIHPANIDGARHQYGVFHERVSQAVVDTDRFVQQLMGVQEELGLAEQTNLVVTSDHGQMEVQRIMNLNVMLADYGFLDVREDGYVADWRADCLSNGLSAVVYLKNPLDEKLYQRVFQLLRWMRNEGVYGIGEVLTAEEAEEKYRLNGPFSFVLESDDYTSFGENTSGPLVESFGDRDYRYGRASHGYYPQKGPQPVFMAKGPDFAESAVLEKGRLIDQAPTYAMLLGVELPDTDGTPIEEFVRKTYA